MERYAKGELELWDLANIYEWEFDSAIPEPFPTKMFGRDLDLRERYYNQGIEFLSNFQGYSNCKLLGIEEGFDLPIDDWVFNGFIDLVLEDPDGKLIVQDYKSKANFKSKKEKAEYARQLYLYSLWVKKKYGRYPDLLRFLMFRENRVVDIPFDKSSLDEAVNWAKDTVKDIRECWDYEPTCDEFFATSLCNHRSYCDMKPDFSKDRKYSKRH